MTSELWAKYQTNICMPNYELLTKNNLQLLALIEPPRVC